MFRTKFKSISSPDGGYIVIYKKWYQLSWQMLATRKVLGKDPYRFPNEGAVDYMVKCLEETGL